MFLGPGMPGIDRYFLIEKTYNWSQFWERWRLLRHQPKFVMEFQCVHGLPCTPCSGLCLIAPSLGASGELQGRAPVGRAR